MPSEAAEALKNLTGYQVLNKRLKASYSRHPSVELKNANVYIAGYGSDLKQQQLEAIFSNYGTIINVNMLRGINFNLIYIFFICVLIIYK